MRFMAAGTSLVPRLALDALAPVHLYFGALGPRFKGKISYLIRNLAAQVCAPPLVTI
jgi:hypothetical protein